MALNNMHVLQSLVPAIFKLDFTGIRYGEGDKVAPRLYWQVKFQIQKCTLSLAGASMGFPFNFSKNTEEVQAMWYL